MFDWLKKKGQDSRVYMCIKEVKWELESADQIKRARILATTSALGSRFFSGEVIPIDVVNRPLDYSRENLMQFYEILEDIRNDNSTKLAKTKKIMGNFEMEFPAYAEDHAKTAGRAIEVWMSTVGAGIAPDRRDDVRTIWRLLVQSKPFLDTAMDEILLTEKRIFEMAEQQSDGIFINYDRQEWRNACNFVPSQFVKELDLK